MGLGSSPGCDRYKQTNETITLVLCDFKALTVFRFRHLAHHFLKPGDSANISVSRIMNFVLKCGTAEF